jgi:hypothetical protein
METSVAWVDRFLPVRTTTLEVNGPVAQTEKATDQQLVSYVRNVSEVYRRLAAGVTPEQFEVMRRTAASPAERELGETFHQLFSDRGRDGRIEAEFVDGRLVVQRGRHRVLAAQQSGVPVLPVHVRAQDTTTMVELSTRIERELAVSNPETLAQHRALVFEQANAARAAGSDSNRDDSRGDNVPLGSEGTSQRKGPEYEPRPARAGSSSPASDAPDIQRELARRALADNSPNQANSREGRLAHALGKSAIDATRAPSEERSRDRR